jgi:tetratricopeptide (TPR) repeat protein
MMGNGFVRLNDYEKALKAFDDALELCEKHNIKFLEGYLKGNKGLLLAQDRRYFDDGVMLLNTALAQIQQIGNAPHEFALLHMNALSREIIGQSEKALDYYGIMLSRAQLWNNRAYEGMTFYEIGRINIHSENYTEAIDNFGQALLLSRETMNPFYEAQIEAALGMTYRLLHDYELALTHYMAARNLYDALDDDTRTSHMTQAILLTYINRIVDRLLRFLGIRRKDNQATDEATENDDS